MQAKWEKCEYSVEKAFGVRHEPDVSCDKMQQKMQIQPERRQ